MKIGLQLYTIRDSYGNTEEFKTALKKVKELGYEGVEFAGYADMAAEDLKSYLNVIGLIAISSHQSLDDLENNLEEIIRYNKILGSKFVVCAFAPTNNMEEVERVVRVMGKAKKELEETGLMPLYHNHSHELKNISDLCIPLELIKDSCNLELDTYWAFHAGVEPCSYIRKNIDNISLLHLKDGNFEGHPMAIGEGYNNIKGIVETAKIAGLEWVIVENDNPTPDGLSDVARSIEYLKSNIL
jgi:sugar phosphate isomerase/epimerase